MYTVPNDVEILHVVKKITQTLHFLQHKPNRRGRGGGPGEQLQRGACGGAHPDLRRLWHRRRGLSARLAEGQLGRRHRRALRRLHRQRHQGMTRFNLH